MLENWNWSCKKRHNGGKPVKDEVEKDVSYNFKIKG